MATSTVARSPSVAESSVVPPGPYRLPRATRDGVVRKRGGVLTRLIHHGDDSAVVSAWVTAREVRLRAEATSNAAATHALERMRFAIGADHDLRPFARRFARDPLLGPIVRLRPWLRPPRRAQPFEALAWAITEQLIEGERAYAIQRRLVHRYGRASGSLVDVPSATTLAARAPAEVEACGLSPRRAITMIRASREVAAGRADMSQPGRAAERLRRIDGVGAWTLECLGLHGHGNDDDLPAGDLAYLKLVGRIARLGRRATVEEVRAFFEPYEPFRGLAGIYLQAAEMRGLTAPTVRRRGL